MVARKEAATRALLGGREEPLAALAEMAEIAEIAEEVEVLVLWLSLWEG